MPKEPLLNLTSNIKGIKTPDLIVNTKPNNPAKETESIPYLFGSLKSQQLASSAIDGATKPNIKDWLVKPFIVVILTTIFTAPITAFATYSITKYLDQQSEPQQECLKLKILQKNKTEK